MAESLPQRFTMEFEPSTIKHLGLKLYSTLPPVIGELVSNSWDAEAHLVDVTLPVGPVNETSEVVVRDNGLGMVPKTLQDEYLDIGRDRREKKGSDLSETGLRKVTGHKGLGKLSGFGVALELEVRSVRDGFAVCIRLSYTDIEKWPKGTLYEPTIVHERSGPTTEDAGTEIRLRRFRRTKAIDSVWIRQELARRFTVIGDDFVVRVNGVPIQPADRRLKKDCKAAWDVTELAGAGVVDAVKDWKVEGWIGLLETSAQVERGVDLFARGKAVELATMFDLRTTHAQFGRAYVVGEVHAEFLDDDEDFISTARNSVTWETEAGARLQEWGRAAVLDVLKRWLDLQHKEKEEQIFKTSKFDQWLKTRSKRERQVARRMLDIIIKDDSIEPAAAAPLLEVVKSNIEFTAFQELVDEIEGPTTSVSTLLKLFDEWRIYEARQLLQLSDGQLEVMKKFAQFIAKGALEVKQMQPLFEENLWLIDPTWTAAEAQTTYTTMIRKYAKELPRTKPEDRRIDILGIRVGSDVEIVEIKRPQKKLSWMDLDQVEQYVSWARANLIGTGPHAPRYVRGRLVVGKLNPDGKIKEKVRMLAGSDIRVETYGDLLERSKNVYGSVEKRFKSIAPEYSKAGRKKAKKTKPKKK